jgi:hypothetical protein
MLSKVVLGGGPDFNGNEPVFSREIQDFFHFTQLIAYPQRAALEPLLTIA